jgi:hypothetical protein
VDVGIEDGGGRRGGEGEEEGSSGEHG